MPAGRPTAYREEYAGQAYKLCLLGATDVEMADIFGVSEPTLIAWRKAHPDFLKSTVEGKTAADANVAERLYKRSLGYSHEAVKIFMPSGASEPVYAPYTEHYPPDTQAASLWLRNRQPGKWRDKQEHELSGAVNTGLGEIAGDIARIFGLAPAVMPADDPGRERPVVSGKAKRGGKARS